MNEAFISEGSDRGQKIDLGDVREFIDLTSVKTLEWGSTRKKKVASGGVGALSFMRGNFREERKNITSSRVSSKKGGADEKGGV